MKRSKGESVAVDIVGGANRYYHPGLQGDYTNVSAVYQCVNVIAKNVARLPLLVEAKRDGVYQPSDTDWFKYIFGIQPNEDQSAYEFKSQVIANLLTSGNAVIVPMFSAPLFGDERGRTLRNLERLVPITPGCVSYDTLNHLYRINDQWRGIVGDYTGAEVIHLRMPSREGIWGISPITHARLTIETILAADSETNDRFRQGGNIQGFITNETPAVQGQNKWTKQQLEAIAQMNNSFFATGGGISYLPGNAKFQQLSMTSADLQFLESRKFEVKEICRWFGVSPSFVFEGATSNYQESQKVRADFVTDTLDPLLIQLETEFRRKLLTWRETLTTRFRFDRGALASSDPEAAVRLSSARIAAGLESVNEARASHNRPPVEGGDTLLMSANLKTIEALTAEGITDAQTNNNDNGTEH